MVPAFRLPNSVENASIESLGVMIALCFLVGEYLIEINGGVSTLLGYVTSIGTSFFRPEPIEVSAGVLNDISAEVTLDY